MIDNKILESKIFEVLRNSSESDKQQYRELYRLDKDIIIITVDGLKCEITPKNFSYYSAGIKAYSYMYVQTIEIDKKLFEECISSE